MNSKKYICDRLPSWTASVRRMEATVTSEKPLCIDCQKNGVRSVDSELCAGCYCARMRKADHVQAELDKVVSK
jgi:hypothetical protein